MLNFWRNLRAFFLETAEVVLIALAIVLPVRYFIIQPFIVYGQSMEPSFFDKDYLVVDELSFRLRSIKRGEVIIFEAPAELTANANTANKEINVKGLLSLSFVNVSRVERTKFVDFYHKAGYLVSAKVYTASSTFFIKRVIGLPGEKVTIQNGTVKIYNAERPEGFILNEPYLSNLVKTTSDINVTLPPQQYFVMGDNRMNSYDSRSWGSLNGKAILGRVWLRVWPLSHAAAFGTNPYSL
ncbi:MAG TPA: signal peptidase I [Candidatus Paceibacterota bacterium]|nr:signal peptidase I [Candidatus Paceibacterota bacterium]